MTLPAFRSKKEVAEFLAKRYMESDCYALSNVNVSKLTARVETFYESYRYPFQPNIDVLWYDPSTDELNGIAVKYFRGIPWTDRLKKQKPAEKGSQPYQLIPSHYYAGISEAIALLNYGLDYSWLFQVFDDNVNNQLAELASNSAARILAFTPIAYMVIIHSEAKMLTAKVHNPCLNENDQLKRLRKVLIEGLKHAQ